MENEVDGNTDLFNDDVVRKYHFAADIVNLVMAEVCKLCVDGASIYEICNAGDKMIEVETSKVFNKKDTSQKKTEKGIAFPTCISTNELCGNFSPLKDESKNLQNGDLVKVELGCHIDGYICVEACSLVIGSNAEQPLTGRKADLLAAVNTAAEAALRLLKPGNKNTDVTAAVTKAAQEFNCNPIIGSLSHEIKKNVIEGSKMIASRDSLEDKVDEFTFKTNEAYTMNILLSSGEGRVKETEIRTTVFKRAIEVNYTLRTPLARSFINYINKNNPHFPFSVSNFEDQKSWRLGVGEAARHELINPYSVLTERQGEYVANVKFTVLLLSSGTKRIAKCPLIHPATRYNSEFHVKDEKLKALLATSVKAKKKKKKAVKMEEKDDANSDGDVEMA